MDQDGAAFGRSDRLSGTVRGYDRTSYPRTPLARGASAESSGSPHRADGDVVVSVRFPGSVLEKLDLLRSRLGFNRSACIRMAVDHYLAAHGSEAWALAQSRRISALEGWPAQDQGLCTGDIVRLASPLPIHRSRTSDLAVVLQASPWVACHPTLSLCPIDTTIVPHLGLRDGIAPQLRLLVEPTSRSELRFAFYLMLDRLAWAHRDTVEEPLGRLSDASLLRLRFGLMHWFGFG